MDISGKIKQLRLDKCIKLVDAAKDLDISPSTLCGWESGYRKPGVDEVKKLADLYKVSVEFLIRD